MRILMLIIALVTLAGCGQKGPLYLEKRDLEKAVPEQAEKPEKNLPDSSSPRMASQPTLLIASHPATGQQGK